jgi:hypothetical protein
MTTYQQVYTKEQLQANLEAVQGYLRRACERLGNATDPADVELAAGFIESAGAEIERWTAALGKAKR